MVDSLHPVSKIICGQCAYDNLEINKVSDRLSNTIDGFSKRLLDLDLNDDNDRIIAPFYARTILEACSTALLLRIDPFRVLSVYKVQSTAQYDVTKKSNVSILWTGDILANNKPKPNIWHPENKLADYDRALLSNYTGDLFWKPAYINVLDYLDENSNRESNWLNDKNHLDENGIFEWAKTESMKLYSFFSKGVHYEFLIETDSVYDYNTVKTYVERMFQLLSYLGLVSHFISTMSSNLDKSVALNAFLEIEELVSRW